MECSNSIVYRIQTVCVNSWGNNKNFATYTRVARFLYLLLHIYIVQDMVFSNVFVILIPNIWIDLRKMSSTHSDLDFLSIAIIKIYRFFTIQIWSHISIIHSLATKKTFLKIWDQTWDFDKKFIEIGRVDHELRLLF